MKSVRIFRNTHTHTWAHMYIHILGNNKKEAVNLIENKWVGTYGVVGRREGKKENDVIRLNDVI